MPNLEALAKESVHFSNLYEQTHLGTTADGEFVSMQSLHSLAVGVVANRYNRNRYRSLASVSDMGYSTVSMAGEPGNISHMNIQHAALGFRRSFFDNTFQLTERINGRLADGPFFRQAAHRLAAQPEPFLALLMTSSNHHPWKLPNEHRQLSLGLIDESTVGNYIQSVHYLDSVIGQFVGLLRMSGVLDRTVLRRVRRPSALSVERRSKRNSAEADTGAEDFALLRACPAADSPADGASSGERTTVGGQIDIAPTLLGLLGVDDPRSVMLGSDLTLGRDSSSCFVMGAL